MKKAFLVCVIAALAAMSAAQTPAWEWAVSGGGAVNDYCNEICTDSAGNSYTTGSFQGTAYFGSFTISSAGTQDVFVAKTDPSGNYVWVVRGGGTGGDQGWAIARDNSGNLFVSGYYSGTSTFGTYSVTAVGQFDMFVAKLDPSGNWLWARSGGSAYYDHSYGVSTDAAGNCYATGYFNGNAIFGPYTLSGPAFWGTIWVAKLDPDGNWLWAVSGGGPDDDTCESIATDSAGYSYITGNFEATSTFGAYSVTSFGGNDILVAKLDPDGNWLWAQHAGGLFPEGGNSVALDAEGKCYITGSFSSENATFGSQVLHSDGWDYEIFAACLDSDGNWLWATGTEPTDIDSDFGQDIIPDGYGNCYITGYIDGTAIFGTTTLSSFGLTDIFVAKLDSAGNWVWAIQAGSANTNYGDSGAAIAVSPGTHVLVAGACSYLCSFGSITLTNYPMYANAYVASIYDEAQIPPPGPATLLSPADGAMNLPLAGFDLTWEPDPSGGAPESYVVYLSSDPADMFTQQSWTVYDTQFDPAAGGMAFGNDETWYWTVKAVNSGGEAVTDPPFSFTTITQWVVNTFPSGWDFEGATFPPDGWTAHDMDGGGAFWQASDLTNHTPGGNLSAFHSYSVENPEGQSGWLITPPVEVPSGQFMTLKFWHTSWWEDYYGHCGVWVSGTGNPNDQNWTELWSAAKVCNEWLPEFVNISAYGGQTVYFAFKYEGYDGSEWFVDDVSIYQVQPVASFPAGWGFEDASFPPEGWTLADLDGIPTFWHATTDHNHTPDGSLAAAHNYSSNLPEPGQNGWLITPPVQVPAGLNMALSFWRSYVYAGANRYSAVEVNTVNDPYDPGWEELWHPNMVSEEWQEQTVNISAYGGQTVYFAFHYQGYDADNWIVDDISIYHPEGTDTLGPVISFLPPLNTPRTDRECRVTATVTDDPLYNNALGGVVLHYKLWGAETYTALPMTLESGNTYYANIPAPGFLTEIDYYFEAWDINNNYANTEIYNWFYVENPCWLSYDIGGTGHWFFSDEFGAAVVYENPFFDLDIPMKLLQTGCGSSNASTATLHVYAYDGESLTDLMPPLPVNLNEGEWITYHDLSALEVMVETQYFVVAYEDIPVGTGIWHDRRLDYGASFRIDDGVLSEMLVPGSWVIPAQITNGGMLAPEITITPVDWYWQISWEQVPGAAGYNFWGSNDPYAEVWTLLQTTPDSWVFYQEPEPMQFFRVTTLSELPSDKSGAAPYPRDPAPRLGPSPSEPHKSK